MITQLQAEYEALLERRLTRTQLRLHKTMRTKMRRMRSLSFAWYRRQYFVWSALPDTKRAVARNEDIFLGICLVGVILGFAFLSTAAELAYTFFMTALVFSIESGVSALLLAAVAAGSLAVVLGWLTVFLLNALSISVMHGANRKINKSLRSTLRDGLRYVGRVTIAWVMLMVAVLTPVALVGGVALLHFFLFIETQEQALSAAPYYIIAAFAGGLMALLRYALLPYVSLFEPTLSLKDSFKRSSSLLVRKGTLFVLFGYMMLTATLAGEYLLAHTVYDDNRVNAGLAFGLLSILSVTISHLIMTMFYRKRRLARS